MSELRRSSDLDLCPASRTFRTTESFVPPQESVDVIHVHRLVPLPCAFFFKVLHTHLLDFDAAGPLYDTALKLSGENPLVQRACGLFLLSSCRFPREQSRTKGLALLSAADYRCAIIGLGVADRPCVIERTPLHQRLVRKIHHDEQTHGTMTNHGSSFKHVRGIGLDQHIRVIAVATSKAGTSGNKGLRLDLAQEVSTNATVCHSVDS